MAKPIVLDPEFRAAALAAIYEPTPLCSRDRGGIHPLQPPGSGLARVSSAGGGSAETKSPYQSRPLSFRGGNPGSSKSISIKREGSLRGGPIGGFARGSGRRSKRNPCSIGMHSKISPVCTEAGKTIRRLASVFTIILELSVQGEFWSIQTTHPPELLSKGSQGPPRRGNSDFPRSMAVGGSAGFQLC